MSDICQTCPTTTETSTTETPRETEDSAISGEVVDSGIAQAESQGGALADLEEDDWIVDSRASFARAVHVTAPFLAVAASALTAKRSKSAAAGIAVGAVTWIGLGLLHSRLVNA